LGYFSQFASSQPNNQLSCQTVKFGVVAFPAQQLSLYSSFPCTASQLQPKQTGHKFWSSWDHLDLLFATIGFFLHRPVHAYFLGDFWHVVRTHVHYKKIDFFILLAIFSKKILE
jgi:hypothetical protein